MAATSADLIVGGQDPERFDLGGPEKQSTHLLLEAYQSGTELPPPQCLQLSAAFAVLEAALDLKKPPRLEARRQGDWPMCVRSILHQLLRH